MSSISLDEHCGDLLTVRKTDRANSGVIYETCESSDGPVIFTGHSRNIWVDFVANKNSSGRGFQISFLTIEDKFVSQKLGKASMMKMFEDNSTLERSTLNECSKKSHKDANSERFSIAVKSFHMV